MSSSSPSALRAHRFPVPSSHVGKIGAIVTPSGTPGSSPTSKSAALHDFRLVPSPITSQGVPDAMGGAISPPPSGVPMGRLSAAPRSVSPGLSGVGSPATVRSGLGGPVSSIFKESVSIIVPNQRGALAPGAQQEAMHAAVEDEANAERMQVKVEGFYEQDEIGGLIPSEMPRSRILYVLTASDGRDMMFKTIQYTLLLLICLLKKPDLFSPEAAQFLDQWALRFWYNYNTIRHGRSLFKMGRWILNLFHAQAVIERLALAYQEPLDRIRSTLFRLFVVPIARLLKIKISRRRFIGLHDDLDDLPLGESPASVMSSLSFPERSSEGFSPVDQEGELQNRFSSVVQHLKNGKDDAFIMDLHPNRRHTSHRTTLEDMFVGGVYSHISKAEQTALPVSSTPAPESSPYLGSPVAPLAESPSDVFSFRMSKPVVIDRRSYDAGSFPTVSPSSHNADPIRNFDFASVASPVGRGPMLQLMSRPVSGSSTPRGSYIATGSEAIDFDFLNSEESRQEGGERADASVSLAGSSEPVVSLCNANESKENSPRRDLNNFSLSDGLNTGIAKDFDSPMHHTSMEKTLGPNDRRPGRPPYDDDDDDVQQDEVQPPDSVMGRRNTVSPLERLPKGQGVKSSSSDEDDDLFKPTKLSQLAPIPVKSRSGAGDAAQDVVTAPLPAVQLGDGTAPVEQLEPLRTRRQPKQRPAPIVGENAPALAPFPMEQQDDSDLSNLSLTESNHEGSLSSPLDQFATNFSRDRQQSALRLPTGPINTGGIVLRSPNGADDSSESDIRLAQPASSALPSQCRTPVMRFRTSLLLLFLVRSLAAAGRRILRDLTLISSERFFVLKGVEKHRYRIHNAINAMWFISTSIDVLLNTTRLLQRGWLQYAASRQNIRARCACKRFEDPADLFYRHHNFVTRRKTDLVFPPLDMDYGAPVTSTMNFFEAADPSSMKPACSRCGCIFDVPVQRMYVSENPAQHSPTTGNTPPPSSGLGARGMTSPSPQSAAGGGGDVVHRIRSTRSITDMIPDKRAVTSPNSSTAGSPIGANFKRFEGLRAVISDAATGTALQAGIARSRASSAPPQTLGSPAVGSARADIDGSAARKPRERQDEDVGLMLVPWLMRRLFNYAWLLTVHPNLTSTLLMQIRYMAEWYLAYKYTFGSFECHVRDAPLNNILHLDGAIAGLVAAVVVLTRVIKSAPS